MILQVDVSALDGALTPSRAVGTRDYVASPPMEKTMAKATERKIVHRDSVDGQFVTGRYADQHPRTTERQHVYVPAPKPPKK